MYRVYLLIGGMWACINTFLKRGSFLDVPLVQSEILDNYIADMAQYARNADSVKIRACYNLQFHSGAAGQGQQEVPI